MGMLVKASSSKAAQCCVATGKIPTSAKPTSVGTSLLLSWVQQLLREKLNRDWQRRCKRVRDAQGKNKWCDGINELEGTEKRCKETPRCAHGKKYR